MLTIGDKVKLVCNDGCISMNGVDGDIIGYDNKTDFIQFCGIPDVQMLCVQTRLCSLMILMYMTK